MDIINFGCTFTAKNLAVGHVLLLIIIIIIIIITTTIFIVLSS